MKIRMQFDLSTGKSLQNRLGDTVPIYLDTKPNPNTDVFTPPNIVQAKIIGWAETDNGCIVDFEIDPLTENPSGV